MNGPLKLQRTALLHLMAKMYKLLNDYISGSGSTEETDKFMKQIKDILNYEGFR
jgi:hypothetical protein